MSTFGQLFLESIQRLVTSNKFQILCVTVAAIILAKYGIHVSDSDVRKIANVGMTAIGGKALEDFATKLGLKWRSNPPASPQQVVNVDNKSVAAAEPAALTPTLSHGERES